MVAGRVGPSPEEIELRADIDDFLDRWPDQAAAAVWRRVLYEGENLMYAYRGGSGAGWRAVQACQIAMQEMLS